MNVQDIEACCNVNELHTDIRTILFAFNSQELLNCDLIAFTVDCSRISQLDDIIYTLLTSFLVPVTCLFLACTSSQEQRSQVTFEYGHKKLNQPVKIHQVQIIMSEVKLKFAFKLKIFSGLTRMTYFQMNALLNAPSQIIKINSTELKWNLVY